MIATLAIAIKPQTHQSMPCRDYGTPRLTKLAAIARTPLRKGTRTDANV